MEVTAPLQVQTVRLRYRRSLFDVGQARLKDGSTKVLVDQAGAISGKTGLADPRWLDKPMPPAMKKAISSYRCGLAAQAVRNWMLQTSDIPATCFAVQGRASQSCGDQRHATGPGSQPRVEISLVRVLTPVRG